MKKFIFIITLFSCVLSLASCSFINKLFSDDKYKEEAGTYELYYASGAISKSNYDYWRIILEADGSCTVESKGAGNSQTYSATATFEIEGDKIKIYTKNGSATITEEYDYVNGEIQMLNQQIQGYTFSAKFRRNTETTE